MSVLTSNEVQEEILTNEAIKVQKEALTSKTVIEAKNVNLFYGNLQVLKSINLKVYLNDFVCVLGSSGCGKSSLLQVLAGFLKPTSGEITIGGKQHKKPTPDVGVVFQHPNLFPWLSIEKNIAFGLRMQSVPKTERKRVVSHYLEMVGLQSAAKMLPHQLSGGMKQRASIARTLATNPKVILMDEPFSALDALTRMSMQSHLKEIWKKTQKSIFFITHDVHEALLLGTRIVVMHPSPGRIVLDIPNPLAKKDDLPQQAEQSKEFAQLSNYLLSVISNKK
ncbi:ABC transporter ATP-binding protein [Thermoflavimicrobium dichotomicum]|uniref:NitT/TauT family transport system ATP-binding protein/taurine transport system ATP-binding protein n=1 Tax=Thermoflavimicrobium dichotomicum TaxID=46223 RepID=A0A1I3THC4_9BACL|nr:ABC transporter ATP-binding protein [Thermoflavimicrobium dichotomicum]SFJ69026.1 NitT/TauT family transport system ATP-binding protein/taurine transport system ATP-binding protein [Thermoflavimicrobium dichotomicum]